MITWVAWISVCISIVLLAVLGVLLYRMLASGLTRKKEPQAQRHYVPTTPDETMIISRSQADDMLNK